MTVCVAPIEKFRDYIFKPGATHGKDQVFRTLGYDQEHSEELASLYEKQATMRYEDGDYSLGKQDEYGQRINIEIEIIGIGVTEAGKVIRKRSHLVSGWMLLSDGSITLNTPFAGFSR